MNNAFELLQSVDGRLFCTFILALGGIVGATVHWALSLYSDTKHALDGDFETLKRTDFDRIYWHCVATLAEGYKSGKGELFGDFILRHADHLSYWHKYPGVCRKMKIEPVSVIHRDFRDAGSQLDKLLYFFQLSQSQSILAKAQALHELSKRTDA